jgi:hypothetical protein
MFDGMLYRVTAPTFVAGVIVAQDGVIIDTAPVLRRLAGNRPFAWFRQYCQKRKWVLEYVA